MSECKCIPLFHNFVISHYPQHTQHMKHAQVKPICGATEHFNLENTLADTSVEQYC